jgi:hypothetical protein
MSALRLLNETTASSVSAVVIDPVFTTDFNVYKIVTFQDGFSGNTSIDGHFVDNGSIIQDSDYDIGRILAKASGSFTTETTVNNDDFRSFGEADDDGSTSVSYIYNPMDSNTYTLMHNENASAGDAFNMKGIAALKQTTPVTGIRFFTDNGGTMTNFKCRIYGLRCDT